MEYNSFGETDVYRPIEEILEEQRIKKEKEEQEQRIKNEELEIEKEKERQIIESMTFPEYPTPKKTVTIYILMHGYNVKKPLPTFPTNTIVGGTKVGTCRRQSMYNKEQLKALYKDHKMSVANKMYVMPLADRTFIRNNRAELDKFHSPEEIDALYLTTEKDNHLRRYHSDRKYFLQKDDLSQKMGIQIIHTNVPELKPLELPTDIHELPKSWIWSETPDQAFQKTNLLNVAVATKLDGIGFEKEITTEFTGIPHYVIVSLSDILKYFERFGVEHVNVIDEACRVYFDPPLVPRTISTKEKKDYQSFFERNPLGGKSRRKLKRSKRRSRRKCTSCACIT